MNFFNENENYFSHRIHRKTKNSKEGINFLNDKSIGFESTILKLFQNTINDDMKEYYDLRLKASSNPTSENIKLFEDKRKFIMSNFKLSEIDMRCLDKQADLIDSGSFKDED